MFQKAIIFMDRLWVAAKNEAKWYWSYVLMEIDQAGDLAFYFILFFLHFSVQQQWCTPAFFVCTVQTSYYNVVK